MSIFGALRFRRGRPVLPRVRIQGDAWCMWDGANRVSDWFNL